MKLPCFAVRDLLPLYTEGLTEPETADAVREHLKTCADCRARLESAEAPAAPTDPPPSDGAAALRQVKRSLRRRRWTVAALAALLVFLPLYALLARDLSPRLLSDPDSLLTVTARQEENGTVNAGDVVILLPPKASEANDLSLAMAANERMLRVRANADGTVTLIDKHSSLLTVIDGSDALRLRYTGPIGGVWTEQVTDPDTGEVSVYVQAWTSGWFDRPWAGQTGGTAVLSPKPARVIYGWGEQQTLLYGEAPTEGVQILPRLVLGYYGVIAAGLSAAGALLWLLLRRRPAGAVLRQLTFAPAAWLAGQLLVKGGSTLSFQLLWDMLLIAVAAAAFYGVFTLTAALWRQRRKERIA